MKVAELVAGELSASRDIARIFRIFKYFFGYKRRKIEQKKLRKAKGEWVQIAN